MEKHRLCTAKYALCTGYTFGTGKIRILHVQSTYFTVSAAEGIKSPKKHLWGQENMWIAKTHGLWNKIWNSWSKLHSFVRMLCCNMACQANSAPTSQLPKACFWQKQSPKNYMLCLRAVLSCIIVWNCGIISYPGFVWVRRGCKKHVGRDIGKCHR